MLAGVSHQAAHAHDGAVSVGLARAARDTAAGTGFAALESETAVMEAHGLALVRDKRGSMWRSGPLRTRSAERTR